MRAWRALFADFLTKRGLVDQPYVESDYFDYIDGKPRYDGVRSFLASRGITLAEGEPERRPRTETVCGLGNRKNEFFSAVLRDEGVQPYAGSVELLDYLDERGTKIAVVSSSRNAPPVLEASGLARPVPTSWSTATSPPGSIWPASPRRTPSCTRLNSWAYPIERSVVFEDALSGVEAGRAGGFGLVVGVDRGVGADRLTDIRRRPCGHRTLPSWLAMMAPAATTRSRPRPSGSDSIPDRRVGAHRVRVQPPPTWASPRPCSRSATATSGCAATSRRAGRPTPTAPSSTDSTRSGRSGMRRRRSGSPGSGRRSSTSPTTRPSSSTSTTSRCCSRGRPG